MVSEMLEVRYVFELVTPWIWKGSMLFGLSFKFIIVELLRCALSPSHEFVAGAGPSICSEEPIFKYLRVDRSAGE